MKKAFSILLCVLAATAVLAQAPHKYGIKCAIVKTVTENSGGQKSYTTLWFDDYGAKERSEVTMDMGSGMGEAKWVTISLPDGKSYMLDRSGKSAKTTPRVDVNYLDMPEKVAKSRKAKVIGEEKVGSRMCTKWEEHVKQILHTATVTSWVWKGIPIKYTVDNPRSTTTLVSLEQKSSLPASLFTVPK
ncbi:MAG: hypothetical protein K6E37_03800 [Bacteroidales bacterium]|nr:hypothetical protein [Bacteroidales bacterium]